MKGFSLKRDKKTQRFVAVEPRKIVTYKFRKNSAYVQISWKEPNLGVKRIKDDVLWLEWGTQEKEKQGIGMRPDEALLIAEMLVEAVRVTTHSFASSRPIKNYRIKKKGLPSQRIEINKLKK